MPYIMHQKKAYGSSVADTDSIKYRPQILEPSQKATARANIGAVGMVNDILPDENGELNLNVVPYAENLISQDNYEFEGEYIFRSTAGDNSTNSGEADLTLIKGNSVVVGRIPESLTHSSSTNIVANLNKEVFKKSPLGSNSGVFSFVYDLTNGWTYDGASVTLSTYGLSVLGMVEESAAAYSANTQLVIDVDAAIFGQNYPDSNGYIFTFDGTDWKDEQSTVVDLATIGITVTGTPNTDDAITVYYTAPTSSASITVNYTKEVRGQIKVAKPTEYRSYGLNQFDKDNMVLPDRSINNSGSVVSSSGSYVCYVHCVGGLKDGYTVYSVDGTVFKIGYLDHKPDASSKNISFAGVTLGSNISYISVPEEGYICIATTNPETLCVHPTWSGVKDSVYEDYNVSIVTIPLEARNGTPLPTGIYGMPAVNSVRDELNFDLSTYIQRIERISYTTSALETVKNLGVDYDYDDEFIYYVLKTPVTYNLAVALSGSYIANDYGVEEIVGVDIPIYTLNLYGRNLRDYLRVDVPAKIAQINSNLTDLETLDFSQTSIPSGTSFNEVVQRLMNKIFPNIQTVVTITNKVINGNRAVSATTTDTNIVSYDSTYGVYRVVNGGKFTVNCGVVSSTGIIVRYQDVTVATLTTGQSYTITVNNGESFEIKNASASQQTINANVDYEP